MASRARTLGITWRPVVAPGGTCRHHAAPVLAGPTPKLTDTSGVIAGTAPAGRRSTGDHDATGEFQCLRAWLSGHCGRDSRGIGACACPESGGQKHTPVYSGAAAGSIVPGATELPFESSDLRSAVGQRVMGEAHHHAVQFTSHEQFVTPNAVCSDPTDLEE